MTPWQRVDPDRLNLDHLSVAVAGGTGGIGRLMASQGAKVLVVGRTFRDAGGPGIESAAHQTRGVPAGHT